MVRVVLVVSSLLTRTLFSTWSSSRSIETKSNGTRCSQIAMEYRQIVDRPTSFGLLLHHYPDLHDSRACGGGRWCYCCYCGRAEVTCRSRPPLVLQLEQSGDEAGQKRHLGKGLPLRKKNIATSRLSPAWCLVGIFAAGLEVARASPFSWIPAGRLQFVYKP
jgi:hypothetical protein